MVAISKAVVPQLRQSHYAARRPVESDEWIDKRRGCAALLERHHTSGDLDLTGQFPVLSFLENLSYLARRGAIDKMMVWNKFGWITVGYYYALTRPKNALVAIRDKEKDSTLYEEFEWLFRESVRIYRSKGVMVDHSDSIDDRIRQLINWESSLKR
ncbi:MAG: hypothetical protein IPK82_35035 [Polyangiaceae bacterium]|nr:hypothetical protein [Polyangiaceae bacterium]